MVITVFQFLIGKLKSLGILLGTTAPVNVSIPHRQAKI